MSVECQWSAARSARARDQCLPTQCLLSAYSVRTQCLGFFFCAVISRSLHSTTGSAPVADLKASNTW